MPNYTVTRWVLGYRFPIGKGPAKRIKKQRAVVRAKFSGSASGAALSFLDLIELLAVREFKRRGIALPEVRKARDEASRMFGTDHPFAFRKFKTDGRKIFTHLSKQGSSPSLVQLGSAGQALFAQLVEKHLVNIAFDPVSKLAMKWWPLGRGSLVILDPTITFGAPVLEGTGIRTLNLYNAWKAEGSAKRVARWFEVEERLVIEAVRFEESKIAA